MYYDGGDQPIGDSFSKISLPSVKDDKGGNWDKTNNWYVCPRSGIYQYAATFRVKDNTPAGSTYGVGVHNNEEDGIHFLWHAVGASPSTRSTYPYSRINYQNAGDRMRLISFASSGVSCAVAALQVTLISEAY